MTITDPGKVHGEKLKNLFSELLEKRTIISMYMVGTGFERLTCITEIRNDQKIDYLVVDLPDGFKTEAGKSNELNLRFNFNGPDNLEYLFSTAGGVYEGNLLIIPFPDFVERLQRRRNFRVIAPPGCRVLLKANKLQAVLGIVNISLGGVLGALLKHNLGEVKGPILRQDQRIMKLGLLFPPDEDMEKEVVIVRKSEVRRIEHDKEAKIYRYAFEFMDIDKEAHRKLTRIIYNIQRQQLQRR